MRRIIFCLFVVCFLLSACNNYVENQHLGAELQKSENINNQKYLTGKSEIMYIEGKSLSSDIMTFPMEEFVGRWNALSNEMYSEFYIESFIREDQEDGRSIYRYNFKGQFELRVTTINAETIERIQWKGKSISEDERYTMLTAWRQVILISNLYFDFYDANQIFMNLGIEPNATISMVEQDFYYKGILFSKTLDNKGNFIFEAILLNNRT